MGFGTLGPKVEQFAPTETGTVSCCTTRGGLSCRVSFGEWMFTIAPASRCPGC